MSNPTEVTVSLMPYLRVRDGAAAIEFYQRAFGAVEIVRLAMPDGKIANAEMKIGNADFMLADETPGDTALSPQTLKSSSVILDLTVGDVDTMVDQAVAAGAKIINPVQNHFYGRRDCRIIDPFGHIWIVGTIIEEVSPREMERRFEAL